ncbi:hypothetical protein D9615_006224 [Tricholomella constricta]|uniref:F-box domain-containing protein n=1 Tax=Tricholomella constricta TaxID=117010 RepID=A0A8H5M415_9AGAR|nr:hypothetical protein D9615_006224 [Tricholomella constricta]
MMMSLPPELYLLALAHFPPSSLAAISLCSHRFRIWAFPLLYKRVFLENDRQVSAFALRVIDQELEEPTQHIINGLRFAEHVKCLYVGHDYLYDVTLQLLILAIPSLKQLQGLIWKAWAFYDEISIPPVFALIRDNCNNFDSLSISLVRDGGYDDFMNSALDFRGLKHLQIQTEEVYFWDDELPSIMTKMVQFSPDLETLDLSLHGYGDPQEQWDVDKFCARLHGIRYSRLQCLKLRNAANVDLARLSCISGHRSPFRSFIELNHHNVTILSLPPPTELFDSRPDDLHLPADMFPNLREFEGTVYWCYQISKLRYPASHLRKMEVLMDRPRYDDDDDDDDDDDGSEKKAREMAYRALRSCSALTELVFCGDVVTADFLKTLSECAPGLQTLACYRGEEEVEATELIISALACFKHLRRFTTNVTFEDEHILLMDSIMSSGREPPLVVDNIDEVLREEDWW